MLLGQSLLLGELGKLFLLLFISLYVIKVLNLFSSFLSSTTTPIKTTRTTINAIPYHNPRGCETKPT